MFKRTKHYHIVDEPDISTAGIGWKQVYVVPGKLKHKKAKPKKPKNPIGFIRPKAK